MTVFQRHYRGLQWQDSPGQTPRKKLLSIHQQLVMFRYALKDTFRSRLFTIYYAICFIPPLAAMCVIYMGYNLEVLNILKLPLERLVTIDKAFFVHWVQMPQMFMVFGMIMFIGPALISPDINHNALPLYFSRPISKTGYILGKLSVLFILGSIITWVPSLLLAIFHASLSDDFGFFDVYHLSVASIATSIIWIISLSLLSLAISAWVKWKAAARLFFFGLIWFCVAIGNVIQYIFTHWIGSAFDLINSLEVMMVGFYGIESDLSMPFHVSILVFATLITLSLSILMRKIRAFEVVS